MTKLGRERRSPRKPKQLDAEPEVFPDQVAPIVIAAPVVVAVERELRAWLPPMFTRSRFRSLVEAFELGAPVEIADLVEVHQQIKASISAGYALDVVPRAAGYKLRDGRILSEPAVEVSIFGDDYLASDLIAIA